jgi:hypothetical protein
VSVRPSKILRDMISIQSMRMEKVFITSYAAKSSIKSDEFLGTEVDLVDYSAAFETKYFYNLGWIHLADFDAVEKDPMMADILYCLMSALFDQPGNYVLRLGLAC